MYDQAAFKGKHQLHSHFLKENIFHGENYNCHRMILLLAFLEISNIKRNREIANPEKAETHQNGLPGICNAKKLMVPVSDLHLTVCWIIFSLFKLNSYF